MDQFKLDAIRVGKEHGAVPRCVVVFCRRIENRHLLSTQEFMETIDLRTTWKVKREMVKAGRVSIMGGVRFCAVKPDAQR